MKKNEKKTNNNAGLYGFDGNYVFNNSCITTIQ
jgi:hypothetical protein